MQNEKTILITGASSGIGKAAAKFFAGKGWNVVATMRGPDKETELTGLNNVLVARLDVQARDSIGQAIESSIARFGKIDALINNAGFSLFGVFEGIQREKIQEQFNVNVFGVMDVTRAMLPHFRKNKGGMIINISSRGGLVGLPMNSLYCASKFALEGFLESLAYELASQNIIVKLVEPSGGVSSTNFGKRMGGEFTQNTPLADYDKFGASVGAIYVGMSTKRMASSDEIAQVIYSAATDGTNRLRYFTGDDTGDFFKAKREMSAENYIEFIRSRFLSAANLNDAKKI